MNYTKAQNIVFKAICNGNRLAKFQFDEDHMFVTPDAYVGFVFPIRSINFNLEKIQTCKEISFEKVICPENELLMTDDLKRSKFPEKLYVRLKGDCKNVFVDKKLLECFQNPRFFQEKNEPKSPIMITESISATKPNFPVGIVCPSVISGTDNYYTDNMEKGENGNA